MLSKVRARIHLKWILYLALSFTLGGTWLATSEGSSLNGFGKVVSNRVEVSPPVSYPNSTPAGPTILEIPGFGDLFVTQCPDSVMTALVQNGFRNTSGLVIDVPSVFFVADLSTGETGADMVPNQEVFMYPQIGSTDTTYLSTFQLGAGTGKNRKVATVTVSGLFDRALNVCRFNAQATVHEGK